MNHFMLRSLVMSLLLIVFVSIADAQDTVQEKADAPTVDQLRAAAAGGDVQAMLRLGEVFETGSMGIKADPKSAFRQYKRVSESGSVVGDFHMARCHDTGVGVSKNPVLATRLYRKAAMAGVVVANTVMARRYFEGKGIEADPVAAVGWLVRGAQAGSVESMVLLGERYEKGDVVGKDLNRAGQLYSTAAQRNDPTGNYKLAMLYLKGVGTKADPVRAYVLLSKAQALPIAKTAFEELGKRLPAEQLELAKKKMSEAVKK